MEEENARKAKCPWCPNAGGCTSCSFSGEEPRSYTLVPLSSVDRLVARMKKRWFSIIAALVGALIATATICFTLLILLFG